MKLKNLPTLLIIAACIAGCSSSNEPVREKLDPLTAVTITSSASPLIFYRDNSAHAAHARDFVYVGPVRVNNMGGYRYFLWFGVWSAIPDTPPSSQRDGFETVTIFADGEPLQLSLAGWGPTSIGASEAVYLKPVASAADAYYEVTVDQIRFIAESRDLRLLSSGPAQSSYELWDNQQAAFASLREFLDAASY